MNKIPRLKDNPIREYIINHPEEIYEEFKDSIEIVKYIGRGGSGIVFLGKVSKNHKKLSLYVDDKVVIKICDPDITLYGCLEMKKEVINTYIFEKLNTMQVCYNFPIVYGYFHNCLFFGKSDKQKIITFINSNIKKGQRKDALLLYAITPPDIILPKSIVSYVKDNFQESVITEAENIIPKTYNVVGLLEYSNWEKSDNIFDYLDAEIDLDCSIFILFQYLPGLNLLELTLKYDGYKLSNSLFFECIYSTLSSIHFLNKIHGDTHLDNMMIVDTSVSRLYKYRDSYYVINNGSMFYWIDFAVLKDAIIPVKSYFMICWSVYSQEQREWLYRTFLNNTLNSKEILVELFNWISEKEQMNSLDEIDLTSNHLIIETNKFFL